MNFSKLSKIIATGALSVVGTAGMPQTAFSDDMHPGEGVPVTYVQIGDDSTGWIMGEIYGQMLSKLGYEIQEPLNTNIPLSYQAVSSGDVDFNTSAWVPLHNVYIDTPGFNGTLVGNVIKQGALQGYLVDKASAEKFNIKTLDDFKRPEVKEAFDRNGDGKADMVACPPGWSCELTIAHQMDAFGLRDDINLIKAGYTPAMADLIGAYDNGEPVLFYTWTPNWTVNELKPGEDVVWIETPGIALPDDQDPSKVTTSVEGLKGCVADPCQLGWPINDIRVIANNDFLAENPAAKKLFEEASLPIDFIYAQNAAMRRGEDKPEDIRRQASEWIASNREEIDQWLNAAREAAKKQ